MTQTLTYTLPNVDFELLSADEARDIWQKKIEEAEYMPWVAFLNQFDLGDTVRIKIQANTDAESARNTKRLINAAAKHHQAGAKGKDGKRVLHSLPDGAPKLEPVKIKYTTVGHEEERRAADGKTKKVYIVDRLSLCLVASVAEVTTETPVETPTNGVEQPGAVPSEQSRTHARVSEQRA